MDGKTVIITGANRGLGKATAKELAIKGAKVILACRNLTAGEEARDEIVVLSKNKNVLVKKLDLTSRKSIQEFASDIISTETRLDVLIHNAGVATSENVLTEDGLELTMATNHFGPFLLTHLLIDLLQKSAPSRIVVVGSIAHFLGWVDSTNLNSFKFPQWKNYFNSKVVNICFTRELSKRLKGTNVTVNCLNPGILLTDIWNVVPSWLTWPFNLTLKRFLWDPSEGSKRILYLAMSEEVAGLSGHYFHNDKIAWTSCGASNDKNCELIWKESQNIWNLKNEDSII